jgi:hypothetical protein
MCEGNDFVKDVILILFVPGDPVLGRTPVTVKTLGVDTVDAADLEPAFIDFIPQGIDKPPVFIVVEPASAGRKDNNPGTAPSKKEQFHVASQLWAMPAMIFPVHSLSIQQAYYRLMAVV